MLMSYYFSKTCHTYTETHARVCKHTHSKNAEALQVLSAAWGKGFVMCWWAVIIIYEQITSILQINHFSSSTPFFPLFLCHTHTHTHSLLVSVGEGDFSQTDRGERQHSFTDGRSGIRWNLYKTDFDYMPKHLHVSLCVCVCVWKWRDKKRRMKRRGQELVAPQEGALDVSSERMEMRYTVD